MLCTDEKFLSFINKWGLSNDTRNMIEIKCIWYHPQHKFCNRLSYHILMWRTKWTTHTWQLISIETRFGRHALNVLIDIRLSCCKWIAAHFRKQQNMRCAMFDYRSFRFKPWAQTGFVCSCGITRYGHSWPGINMISYMCEWICFSIISFQVLSGSIWLQCMNDIYAYALRAYISIIWQSCVHIIYILNMLTD